MIMSLPDLRAALDLANGDKDDELLRAGEAVARMMESYTQRPLRPQTLVESFYPPITFPVFLRGFPVIEIQSIAIGGTLRPLGDFRYNSRTGRLWSPGIYGFRDADELEVTYRAGFNPMPEDLKHVFVEAVKIARVQQDRTNAAALPEVTVSSTGPVVRSISIPDAISLQYDLSGGVTNTTATKVGNVWADTPLGSFTGILDSYKSDRAYGSFG